MQAYATFASQMGRFETEWFASSENLASLADLSGKWMAGSMAGYWRCRRPSAHQGPRGATL